jgi:hypothetical protein
MKIYLHQSGSDGPTLVQVDATTAVEELAAQHASGQHEVWLEEADKPLSRTATLEEAGVRDRQHVHLGRCARVEVTVRFGGDSKTNDFAPGARIAAVFAWATGKKGFDLTPTQRAKHGVGVCGTNVELDKADHIGSHVGDDCSLCLDLAPKERFAG